MSDLILNLQCQFWNPYLEKDIQKLEKIQNRATKTIPELRHMLNEDRNRQLNLTSLRTRRLRGDLIQQFRIIHGIDSLEWPTGNNFANSLSVDGVVKNLRGHKYRITSEITKNNDRFNFFKNRIAEHWNKLTNEIVGAKSTNSFKAKIDKYFKENNIL